MVRARQLAPIEKLADFYEDNGGRKGQLFLSIELVSVTLCCAFLCS
jgi:hypothetical protein